MANLLVRLADVTLPGHTEEYFRFMRMDRKLFATILVTIRRVIQKKDTNWRLVISAETRLAITLRHLAHGDSYETLNVDFLVSMASIKKIIPEVCDALVTTYISNVKLPSTETEWLQVANRYGERWNFERCVGAIDGKHIKFKSPGKGSERVMVSMVSIQEMPLDHPDGGSRC